MSADAPSVAIVIPVRNGEAMVRACVAACLAQSRRAREVIVVDNGSTDRTASEAAAAGATVLFESRRGSFMARNRGWRAAAADIIAFTDVDCVPEPTWLAELTEPFGRADVEGVGGAIVQADRNSASQRWIVERRFLDQQFNADHVFLPFFATANVAYRRRVLEELDGFDETFHHTAGDNDMSWRVQALAGGHLVYRPSARVQHHVGESATEVTARWRRYSAGIYLLERRWSQWPGFPETPGFWRRTRRVWELPFALAHRAATRRPLSIAAIDAAVAVSSEIGRFKGYLDARTNPVTPLRGPSR
ncbi:MAG TPA: glycosyltransferase [Acidimicrobiales bacterium]|nr:glycosyltransferase [Acidimicrobiales bacterium]